jgi:hypothetical protein
MSGELILVIEDNELNLKLVRDVLVAQELGCEGEYVDRVEGLEPALERAKAPGRWSSAPRRR